MARRSYVIGLILATAVIIIVAAAAFAFQKAPAQNPQATNDSQTVSFNDGTRKAALGSLQPALQEYFDTYHHYPAALSALTTSNPPIFKTVPADPINSGAYVYTYTPNAGYTAYTLTACLQGAGNDLSNVVDNSNCPGSHKGLLFTNN